MHFRTTRE